MSKTNFVKYAMPLSPQPFRVSRAATGLLIATLTLAALLVFSTLKNINRAQLLMENVLYDKGETIIHSIEASSRASMIMMHHMNGVDPLHTLLVENSKGDNVIFINILNTDGSIIDQAGYPEGVPLTQADVESMAVTGQASTRFNREAGMFIFSKLFTVGDQMRRMHMPEDERQKRSEQIENNKNIISIGILTEQFDLARKQDVRHAMFMGAILFLVGSAGIYVLFLYQKMRFTGATLANMKLYTDSVMESIPVSLVTLDAMDRIVSCNKNTEELFGYPLRDLQNKNIHEALASCTEAILEACSTLFEHSAEGIHRDGRTIPLRISCSPLVNQENEKIGKVLVIRDMSSMRSMELQLERSRRMAALGKMAAGIAHEIRNPLGTLRGFAQFFGNQENANEDNVKYSELMVSEIDRLNHTVSGLLQFSRPREPHLDHVTLDDLLKKTVTLMEADLASHAVQFHCQINTGIELQADPDLILQVLMNLLKNSINATQSGAEISLHCIEGKHTIRISVTDTGCGMSEEEREKMFDPFFTTTRTGTGLGLAVSHQIVEQHHGTFEVVTEKGHGTTVTMVLPK
jgi:two-component system sensor histidine kinase HydH